jgi:hypothetical protein
MVEPSVSTSPADSGTPSEDVSIYTRAQSEGAQGQARQGTGTRRQTEAGTRRGQQASFYSRGVWVWVLTHLVGAVFRALSSQGGRRGGKATEGPTPGLVCGGELPTAVSSVLSCASRRADE